MLKLPEMNEYVRYFYSNNKYINFLVYDKELFQKFNEICDKITNPLKREFESEPMCYDKYIKTKIKI